MVAEFSTLGSCASRLLFNSSVNDGYKKFFHINDSLEVVSIISLMSSPIIFDKNLLDSDDKFDNECAYKDLSKCFLNFLKQNTIDYLLIDTYFDVECDIIVFDENSYLSDSGRISKTSFYQKLTNKKRISIFEDYDEYMKLWVDACDSFFSFLNEYCPNIKIILNNTRGACYYLDENNKKIRFDNYQYIQESNELRDILETYILENFDIDVLYSDEEFLARKNHFAHLHTVHYEEKYYEETTKKLNEIIKRNTILDYNHSENITYRKIKRESALLTFKQRNGWLNIGNYSEEVYNNIVKYNAYKIKMQELIKESYYNLRNKYDVELTCNGSINGEGNIFQPNEDITFNAKVQSHDGKNVKNVIVEFLEDNNIIELTSTNNGGIATLTKSFHNPGIHKIIVRVSNTESGNSMPIFIKEPENRVTPNQWTMGDYARNTGINSLTDISYNKCGGEVAITTDYSDNGQYCLKLYKPANDPGYTFANIELPLKKEDIGKTLTVKFKAFTTVSSNCSLNLFKTEDKDLHVKNIYILKNSDFGEDIELKWDEITPNVTHIQLRFQIFKNIENVNLYVDNLRVYIE